jgi:hypothetical protein
MLPGGQGFGTFTIMVQASWTKSVAQVVDHLSSKCEALSTNPSTAKKKKK